MCSGSLQMTCTILTISKATSSFFILLFTTLNEPERTATKTSPILFKKTHGIFSNNQTWNIKTLYKISEYIYYSIYIPHPISTYCNFFNPHSRHIHFCSTLRCLLSLCTVTLDIQRTLSVAHSTELRENGQRRSESDRHDGRKGPGKVCRVSRKVGSMRSGALVWRDARLTVQQLHTGTAIAATGRVFAVFVIDWRL